MLIKKILMQQRNDTITIMKAFAIICMVAGHSYTGSHIEGFVGLFHMPVFFFCSGYCFKEKYLSDIKSYTKRKILTMWWPTFKWIILLVLLHNILLSIGVLRGETCGGFAVAAYGFKETFKYFCMAVILHADDPVFAGIWFIKMLLISSVLGFVVIKCCKGVSFYLALMGLLVMSVLMLELFPRHMPIIHQLHLPFLSSFFFLTGYFFKRNRVFEELRIRKTYMFSVAVISIIFLVSGYHYWLSSMVSLSMERCLPFCVSAIAGIILVYDISKKASEITPPYLLEYVKFLGNNTYAIFMMHILSFRLMSAILILCCGLDWSRLADFPTIHFMTEKGFWIAYLIFGINLPLLVQVLYNKICCLWKK